MLPSKISVPTRNGSREEPPLIPESLYGSLKKSNTAALNAFGLPAATK